MNIGDKVLIISDFVADYGRYLGTEGVIKEMSIKTEGKRFWWVTVPGNCGEPIRVAERDLEKV